MSKKSKKIATKQKAAAANKAGKPSKKTSLKIAPKTAPSKARLSGSKTYSRSAKNQIAKRSVKNLEAKGNSKKTVLKLQPGTKSNAKATISNKAAVQLRLAPHSQHEAKAVSQTLENLPEHEGSGSKDSLPPRAPMRKIIGRDSKIQSAEIIPIGIRSGSGSNVADGLKLVEDLVPEPVVLSEMQISWDALPKNIPAALRFVVKSAKSECLKASTSLFSFGKFLAALPQLQCGLDFALLVHRLDHDTKFISEECSLEVSRVNAHLDRAISRIKEGLSTNCPDVARKFYSLLASSRKSAATLIEPILISEVDRDLQMFIGDLILFALRCETNAEANAG